MWSHVSRELRRAPSHCTWKFLPFPSDRHPVTHWRLLCSVYEESGMLPLASCRQPGGIRLATACACRSQGRVWGKQLATTSSDPTVATGQGVVLLVLGGGWAFSLFCVCRGLGSRRFSFLVYPCTRFPQTCPRRPGDRCSGGLPCGPRAVWNHLPPHQDFTPPGSCMRPVELIRDIWKQVNLRRSCWGSWFLSSWEASGLSQIGSLIPQ